MTLTTHDFAQSWIRRIRAIKPKGIDAWDWNTALRELKRHDYFKRHEMYVHVFAPFLVREAKTYSKFSSLISEINGAMRIAETTLQNAEKMLTGNARAIDQRFGQYGLDAIVARLRTGAVSLKSLEKSLRESEEQWWTRVLSLPPWDANDLDRVKHLEFVEYPGFVALEPVIEDPQPWVASSLSNAPPGRSPKRELDLDDRFQKRTAYILRDHFPKLSLRTLSRLVVLTYICASLAIEQDGTLRILGGKRNLTPQSVFERLRK